MRKAKIIAGQLLLIMVMVCFLSVSVLAGDPWNECPEPNKDTEPDKGPPEPRGKKADDTSQDGRLSDGNYISSIIIDLSLCVVDLVIDVDWQVDHQNQQRSK